MYVFFTFLIFILAEGLMHSSHRRAIHHPGHWAEFDIDSWPPSPGYPTAEV